MRSASAFTTSPESPAKSDFNYRPHDFSGPPAYTHRSPKAQEQLPRVMSGGHRGLPPPSAMTLPEPGRPPPSTALQSQALGAMPGPPNQWQGAEDSMRDWLSTKAEEERRRAEEEKTRQETLRLETRRVEHSMLRESVQGGVPPQLIPLIFAGIGGTSLVGASIEWIQQYAAQLQQSQQHLQNLDISERDRPQYQAQAQPQPPFYGPMSPTQRSRTIHAPTSAPRSAAQAALPRLTTNEMTVQPPQTTRQDASSPSIYFHHWVPPAATDKPQQTHPQTPSGQPSSAHPSNIGEEGFRDSPRKRKATGPHQPAPPPSQVSPSFSTSSKLSKSGHGRARSNASTRDPTDSARQTPSRRDSVAGSRMPHSDRYDTSAMNHGVPGSPPHKTER